MDTKKLVIIALVMMAVLYLAGVGTHFASKECDNKSTDACKDSYMAKSGKSGGKGGWENSLGSLMSPFAPGLPVVQLLDANRANCDSALYQSQHRVIQLSSSKLSCRIAITAFTEDDFRKGTLTLMEPAGARIKVQFTSNDPEVKSEKDENKLPILTDNAPVNITVMATGGTLVLSCMNCNGSGNNLVRVKFK